MAAAVSVCLYHQPLDKLFADAAEAKVDLNDEDPDMDGWGDMYLNNEPKHKDNANSPK